MTITIPTWLLWIIGIPLGLLIAVFAILGVVLLIAFIRDMP